MYHSNPNSSSFICLLIQNSAHHFKHYNFKTTFYCLVKVQINQIEIEVKWMSEWDEVLYWFGWMSFLVYGLMKTTWRYKDNTHLKTYYYSILTTCILAFVYKRCVSACGSWSSLWLAHWDLKRSSEWKKDEDRRPYLKFWIKMIPYEIWELGDQSSAVFYGLW